jgi:transcription initiation factor TFIIF subunit beta
LSKAKKQDNKAVRVAEDTLREMLLECFSEYKYWSLKSLYHRLNQPEAYIKSILETMAVFHRTGPFTNKWSLSDESIATLEREKALRIAPADKVAPASENGEDDDDEADLAMEDVI